MGRGAADVVVIGGGLAGSEAAWQAAGLGAKVELYEMRPARTTEAHQTGFLGELVCSNSFKSDSISNANGLLKLELKMCGSLLMEIAGRNRVPAGNALCVDRTSFASEVTRTIEANPAITLVREEKVDLTAGAVNILAPGPLASEAAARLLEDLVGVPNLFFYDAVSPIVDAESIEMSSAYVSSRYGKGEATYLNLPLGRDKYIEFVEGLRAAKKVAAHRFEKRMFFSACMPIEEQAEMGDDTLAHGCMKPVGLPDPRSGKVPYAVVQLRPENVEGTTYGMVGFQTRLKYGEQEKLLRRLPGLEKARFIRLGSIHRNTYIRSPRVLSESLEHKSRPGVFMAGQITGAEGYGAAVATGLMAGINAALRASRKPAVVPPQTTVMGGLLRYVSGASLQDYQPMNPNFGLLPKLASRVRNKQERDLQRAERAAVAMKAWLQEVGLGRGTKMTVT
jgi:methylenetetrahydrofolate--tRNA-(uracil-5-)-methyltransferase